MHLARRQVVGVVFAGVAVLGCGDSTRPPARREPPPRPQKGPPGLHVLSGGGISDTIDTRLSQPLVVEVRGTDSLPRAGVLVRFVSEDDRLLVSAPGQDAFAGALDVTTDVTGRAAAAVRLGTMAGAATLTLRATELGLTAAATYTIQPGQPAIVTLAPADTLVLAGAGFQMRSAVSDRHGNARQGAVSYEATGAATVDAAGHVTITSSGVGTVTARVGASAPASAAVTVVSPPTVAGWRASTVAGTDPASELVVVTLDGSPATVLTTRVSGGAAFPGLQWGPDGQVVVYVSPYPDARLYAVDVTGAQRPIVPVNLSAPRWPQVSRDGVWVYFTANSPGVARTGVWRARLDGTRAEELSIPSMPFQREPGYPSPSPDGTRLVFGITYYYLASGELTVYDIATKASTSLGVMGRMSRWSPTSDLIAYLDESYALAVIRADGTGQRQLTPGEEYDLGFSWSPDGQWLIARRLDPVTRAPTMTMVEIATGRRVPLPQSSTLFDPSWRPRAPGVAAPRRR